MSQISIDTHHCPDCGEEFADPGRGTTMNRHCQKCDKWFTITECNQQKVQFWEYYVRSEPHNRGDGPRQTTGDT